jgi:hypothetical protein
MRARSFDIGLPPALLPFDATSEVTASSFGPDVGGVSYSASNLRTFLFLSCLQKDERTSINGTQ